MLILVSQHAHTQACITWGLLTQRWGPSAPQCVCGRCEQPQFLYDKETQQKYHLQSGDGEPLRHNLLSHSLTPLTRIPFLTCRQFVSQRARNKRSCITDTWATKVGLSGWLSLEKLRPSDGILLHRCVRHKQTNRSSSGLISGLSFMSPGAEQVFLGPRLALWVDESHRVVLNKHVFWPEEMWFEAITSRLASTWH